MTLEQFRKKEGLSHKKLAELLETPSASTVFRWGNGERIPRKATMKMIEKKTNGNVKPQSFYA